MGRLISLKLRPSSVLSREPSPSLMSSQPLPIRPISLPMLSDATMSTSQSPRTENEWRRALDEVRASYLKKQYKQCSTRCLQLLEDALDSVHPLHSIYLSFYAATCLELMARPLPATSSQKIFLLELARAHYQKAEYHMWEANSTPKEDHINNAISKNHQRFTSSSSETSTTSFRSSTGSVSDSIFSKKASSPTHSPSSSICSSSSKSQDEASDPLKPRPLRVKKKVSFSLTLPTVISSSSIDTDFNQEISQVPEAHTQTGPSQEQITQMATRPTEKTTEKTSSDSVSSFLLSRSLTHYDTHLTSLATQLTYHISALDSLIFSLQTTPPTQPSHPAQRAQLTSRTVSPPSPPRKPSNPPRKSESCSKLSIEESELEKERKELRKARIEELKRRGEEWKVGKRRFDGSRIERLCEGALKELVPVD